MVMTNGPSDIFPLDWLSERAILGFYAEVLLRNESLDWPQS